MVTGPDRPAGAAWTSIVGHGSVGHEATIRYASSVKTAPGRNAARSSIASVRRTRHAPASGPATAVAGDADGVAAGVVGAAVAVVGVAAGGAAAEATAVESAGEAGSPVQAVTTRASTTSRSDQWWAERLERDGRDRPKGFKRGASVAAWYADGRKTAPGSPKIPAPCGMRYFL